MVFDSRGNSLCAHFGKLQVKWLTGNTLLEEAHCSEMALKLPHASGNPTTKSVGHSNSFSSKHQPAHHASKQQTTGVKTLSSTSFTSGAQEEDEEDLYCNSLDTNSAWWTNCIFEEQLAAWTPRCWWWTRLDLEEVWKNKNRPSSRPTNEEDGKLPDGERSSLTMITYGTTFSQVDKWWGTPYNDDKSLFHQELRRRRYCETMDLQRP